MWLVVYGFQHTPKGLKPFFRTFWLAFVLGEKLHNAIGFAASRLGQRGATFRGTRR
jgi:hypothetical protein